MPRVWESERAKSGLSKKDVVALLRYTTMCLPLEVVPGMAGPPPPPYCHRDRDLLQTSKVDVENLIQEELNNVTKAPEPLTKLELLNMKKKLVELEGRIKLVWGQIFEV